MAALQQGQGRLEGLEKRKACDLCHVKKIRCDAKWPTCSHCIIYEAQCTYTPHIKQRQKEIRERRQVKSKGNGDPRSRPSQSGTARQPENIAPPTTTNTRQDIIISSDRVALPLEADLFLILNDYFTNFNSVIPLFDRARFMTMVREYTSDPKPQDKHVYAAINIVMALTWRNQATNIPIPGGFNADKCIENAESIIPNLATREQDLLGLQVLLGLVLLLQATPHPRQASIVLATAVKLAHRLRINRKKSREYFAVELAQERDNVFWIMYVLDRDISMRTDEPFLLRDDDMDIDMPSSDAGTGDGWVRLETKTGYRTNLSLFQTRIHLARIQGKGWDWIYSIRANSLPDNEKQANVERLEVLLNRWITSIDPELHPEGLAHVSPKFAVRHLLTMYFTYFKCYQMARGVYSGNAEWIKRLLDYSQGYSRARTGSTPHPNPELTLPSRWPDILRDARSCMKLFRLVPHSDSTLVWTVSCAYISSMIVILAHNLTITEHSSHDHFDRDNQLVNEGMTLLESTSPRLNRLQVASSELSCRARVVRTKSMLGQQSSQTTPAVAWLEAEATKSAAHSALQVIGAFIDTDAKPLETRMEWQRLSLT